MRLLATGGAAGQLSLSAGRPPGQTQFRLLPLSMTPNGAWLTQNGRRREAGSGEVWFEQSDTASHLIQRPAEELSI